MSVVIPTYLRPGLLDRSLAAVTAQDPPPDEVVVVHRREDSETARLLERWSAEDPVRRRVVVVDRAGLIHALIAGTEAARAEVVAYLDDDAVPRPGWLTAIRRPFTHPSVGAAGGRILDHVGGRVVTGRARRVGAVTWYGRIVYGHHLESSARRDVDWLTGGNMAMRRELGRHDPRLIHQANGLALANDLDVCLAVRRGGYRVVFVPEAAADHHTTSFRDPALGGRAAGADVVASAANHSFVLLKHFPKWRHPMLFAYWVALGSANLPGPGRALAELFRNPRRALAMARRIPLVFRGRRLGRRMWKENPGEAPAPREPARTDIPAASKGSPA